ncbi:MAG: hypothetical protein JNJ94_00870 [Chlorobi bacterium]|nr:hypothetical protein [Chlorobiota bacterium]
MEQGTNDYDSPWKEIIEGYLDQFFAFYFPEAFSQIDWSRQPEFLDKELRQITREAEVGRRYVDTLAKVWTTEGEEAWVLIHIEVQQQPDTDFAERMYIYNNRIFDLYRRRVASFAVLADNDPRWRPATFSYGMMGTEVLLRFATTKLVDFRGSVDTITERRNVFATVTAAHLRTVQWRRNTTMIYQWKLELIKGLYRTGYNRQQILDLFRFIDWLMRLPEALTTRFWMEFTTFEKENTMPYITSIEQLGFNRGLQQGIEQGIEKGMEKGIEKGIEKGLQQLRTVVLTLLTNRFGELPESVVNSINSINVPETLSQLSLRAVTSASVQEFIQFLENE